MAAPQEEPNPGGALPLLPCKHPPVVSGCQVSHGAGVCICVTCMHARCVYDVCVCLSCKHPPVACGCLVSHGAGGVCMIVRVHVHSTLSPIPPHTCARTHTPNQTSSPKGQDENARAHTSTYTHTHTSQTHVPFFRVRTRAHHEACSRRASPC